MSPGSLWRCAVAAMLPAAAALAQVSPEPLPAPAPALIEPRDAPLLVTPAPLTMSDGVLTVPLPPDWTIWTEEQVARANPDPGEQEILAQAAARPFGAPDFNPTIVLSRLEASQEAPEEIVTRTLRAIPSFVMGVQGVVPFTVDGCRAAAGAGRFALNFGASELQVIARVIAVETREGVRLVTTYSREESPWEAALMALPQEVRVIVPAPEVPLARGDAEWKINGHVLSLPRGYTRWSAEQVAEAQAAQGPNIAGIARIDPDDTGFSPSIAVELAETDVDPLVLVEQTAGEMLGAIPSGEWVVTPTRFEVTGLPAAYAIIRGTFSDGVSTDALEFHHVWVVEGETGLRFMSVTKADDLASRAVFEQMLASLRRE